MKYLINSSVLFTQEDKLLVLVEEKEIFVELSNPATRLLVMFIKHNGVNLSRDDLLKNVWEDYGFASSYALLSNHVSELRKAFTSIGLLTDVIITVPKIGFKSNLDVISYDNTPTANQDKNASQAISSNTEYNPGEIVDAVEATKNSTTRKIKKTSAFKKNVPNVFLISSILLAFVSFISSSIVPTDHLEKADSFLSFSYKKCNIYQIEEMKGIDQENIMRKIKATPIDCLKNKTDIFYIKSKYSNESNNVSLMSACTKDSNEKYSTCTNYLSLSGD